MARGTSVRDELVGERYAYSKRVLSAALSGSSQAGSSVQAGGSALALVLAQ
jgi:hypothetical protein